MSVATSHTGLGSALAAATRKVHGRIHAVVSSAELTVDQWSVLDRIAAVEGPASMTAVAETTGLTGPSLTRAVDKLVTAALVFREVDASDRRRVLVDLSARGLSLHAELAPLVYSAESELVEGSSMAVDELLQALRGLTR